MQKLRDLLRKLQYYIDQKFGWRKQEALCLKFEDEDLLRRVFGNIHGDTIICKDDKYLDGLECKYTAEAIVVEVKPDYHEWRCRYRRQDGQMVETRFFPPRHMANFLWYKDFLELQQLTGAEMTEHHAGLLADLLWRYPHFRS